MPGSPNTSRRAPATGRRQDRGGPWQNHWPSVRHEHYHSPSLTPTTPLTRRRRGAVFVFRTLVRHPQPSPAAHRAPASEHDRHYSSRRQPPRIRTTRIRRRNRRLHRRGPGQGRTRRQGRRQAGRYRFPHRPRCLARDRHRQASRCARRIAPLHRAPAGAGRAAPVPRRAGHHRPGDRQRLLLRLRLRATLHAGRPARHRGGDAEDRQGGAAGLAQREVARRRRGLLPWPGRGVQGARSSNRSRPARTCRCTRRASSPTCAAGRTCRPPTSCARSS